MMEIQNEKFIIRISFHSHDNNNINYSISTIFFITKKKKNYENTWGVPVLLYKVYICISSKSNRTLQSKNKMNPYF